MTAVAFDTLKFARALRERAHLSAEQAEGAVGGVRRGGAGRPADPGRPAGPRRLVKAEFVAVRAEIAAFQAETKAEFAAVRAELAAFKIETRTEFAAVRSELAAFKLETGTEFAAVRSEMKAEFAAVRSEMKNEFAAVRAEIAAFKIETRTEFASVRSEMKLLEQRMTIKLGAMLVALSGASDRGDPIHAGPLRRASHRFGRDVLRRPRQGGGRPTLPPGARKGMFSPRNRKPAGGASRLGTARGSRCTPLPSPVHQIALSWTRGPTPPPACRMKFFPVSPSRARRSASPVERTGRRILRQPGPGGASGAPIPRPCAAAASPISTTRRVREPVRTCRRGLVAPGRRIPDRVRLGPGPSGRCRIVAVRGRRGCPPPRPGRPIPSRPIWRSPPPGSASGAGARPTAASSCRTGPRRSWATRPARRPLGRAARRWSPATTSTGSGDGAGRRRQRRSLRGRDARPPGRMTARRPGSPLAARRPSRPTGRSPA